MAVRCETGSDAVAYVIGVDVGGTFTDAVLSDDAGTVVAAKAPSTPPDYSEGCLLYTSPSPRDTR